MIIHHNIDCFKASKTAITIGTFDGVHLGHLKVIGQLNSIARAIGGESVLFSFYPHPRITLSDGKIDLRLITTLDEKAQRLEQAGIDHLVVYPFTREFASLTYVRFIEQILIGRLGLRTLIVGHDHKLGKNREGSFENIVKLSEKLNFDVVQTETFNVGGVDISSSKIREALQQGDVSTANNYLGYAFSLHGVVTQGNQVGRRIGYPTANIEASDPYKLIPAEGVYAITIDIKGKSYPAMLNIGYRPTVERNADNRTIEAHIFNFDADIYQEEVSLSFYKRIREERRFESLEKLKEQLTYDKENVTRILKSL
ncbi:MAG: bifunctional riboflavin kinase/FAD synthetase [Prolixibacteraceae bacterium]|nr:bifunctional riboflavin kinase/FAD synthetase [Prolixibacteraceae bacterium]MBN2648413.1 bifunctional riboflavin kinase/FAD synthetase [Prolixibacteraceae bacterium]